MLRRGLIGLLLALGLTFTGLLAPPMATATAPVAPLAAPSAPKAANGLNGERVSKRIKAVSRKNLTSTAWAVYTASGAPVVVNDELMVPASTTKVFTALAAIDVLGAKKTFTTKVVSAQKGRITLVAGGDPYLTSGKSTVAAKKANLTDLAAATAKALKQAKVTKVRLDYAADLFDGTSYSPSWKNEWKSYTPRIMSLTVDGGKSGWKAYSDPGWSTAKLFAGKLAAKGIKVTFASRGSLPKGATTIASVKSARLGTMVRHMLRYSDNVAAETLARHVAIKKGKEASFVGGSAAITAWLKSKDLWGKGMKIDGGSGLSSKTKVLPSVLARSVGFALADKRYVDVVKGLPVAGVDGTLKSRFTGMAGRKVVHAKTGSLRRVNALAGYLTTKDGQVLTFAFLATHNGNFSTTARNWLDRSATTLVNCGCS